ncbi:MAG: metallophosphoesterase family protein [Bacteroidetes bacterium]|nr:metallophosphoesterase family protein [Bacteroidota bacterium]
MNIAVISDIHGNAEALQSTLEMLVQHEVGAVYCLGDVVGYGASPNECVDLLRARNVRTIAGNHDKAVLGEIPVEDFSVVAQEAVRWTQGVITGPTREFLASLPMSFIAHQAQFVHSSPDTPEAFRYLLSIGHALESFPAMTEHLCFVGHTHRPAVFCEDGSTGTVSGTVRSIINVGSVGQPRDGDPRSCCVLFDTEKRTVRYLRTEYDVAAAQRRILEAGLPPKLAVRLESGI